MTAYATYFMMVRNFYFSNFNGACFRLQLDTEVQCV